jgi:O-glycosyl hydrolase
VVIIVLNTAGSAIQQGFAVTHGTMSAFSRYTTSVAKNCDRGTDIPAANGGFTATLDPSSVTTFVSQ